MRKKRCPAWHLLPIKRSFGRNRGAKGVKEARAEDANPAYVGRRGDSDEPPEQLSIAAQQGPEGGSEHQGIEPRAGQPAGVGRGTKPRSAGLQRLRLDDQ